RGPATPAAADRPGVSRADGAAARRPVRGRAGRLRPRAHLLVRAALAAGAARGAGQPRRGGAGAGAGGRGGR
ncbi:MAG: hypothetical protein EOO75_20745, partial [Myxococcales bacterium]